MTLTLDSVKERNKLNKLIAKEGKKFLAEQLKTVFTKHDDLSAVVLRMGAPSFNDGDPCTFYVDDPILRTGATEDIDDDYDYDEDASSGHPAYDKVSDIVTAFEGSDYEKMFDAEYGAEVVFLRSGKVEVNDWNRD